MPLANTARSDADQENIIADTDDEQLKHIKDWQQRVAEMDPAKIQAYLLVVIDKPEAGEEDNCTSIEIAGTGPDKYHMGVAVMSKLTELASKIHED